MVTIEDQIEAVTKSWEAPFVRTGALEALAAHIAKERGEGVPYCSIVQSSGMGKSRLLDEFSKEHFLIPVNLRRARAGGYPPSDDDIRVCLFWYEGSDGDVYDKTYSRLLRFLVALFKRTASVITVDLKEAKSRSERITKFREFMTDGQSFDGVGEKRRKFYREIAKDVNSERGAVLSHEDARDALKMLLRCLDDGTQISDTNDDLPVVFIAFDEAHMLSAPMNFGTNRTYLVELCRAFHLLDEILGETSLFSIFVSTSSEVSRLAPLGGGIFPPRTIDKTLKPPFPFTDLGFDQTMQNRKVFDKYKTIDDVTSLECVVHMGRPMWGTLYDYSQRTNRENIPTFAFEKLICAAKDNTGHLFLDSDQQCAVLSQRLALDIDTTAYVVTGSKRNYDMAEISQVQITRHMRVCLGASDEFVPVRGVATSEPILSEEASHIMRGNYNFNLPDALLNVLGAYAINHGGRGELLVAAFFTRARDTCVFTRTNKRFPFEGFCPTFSVKDLLSNLFNFVPLDVVLDSMPSICRPDFPPQKFVEVFGRTRMHFNHLIKPFKQEVFARPYLVAMMARGAAALVANFQPGFDMVLPFLYETSNLVINKVGFIIVQVKNSANDMVPNAELFRKMDPFVCGLLSKEDSPTFTIPIVRFLFELGGEKSFLRQQMYPSTKDGAATLDANGRPYFTSYDFLCSGIGANILQPVKKGDVHKWEMLLGKTDPWHGVFSTSQAPDLRRSQYPAGGVDTGHFDAWVPPSQIHAE